MKFCRNEEEDASCNDKQEARIVGYVYPAGQKFGEIHRRFLIIGLR